MILLNIWCSGKVLTWSCRRVNASSFLHLSQTVLVTAYGMYSDNRELCGYTSYLFAFAIIAVHYLQSCSHHQKVEERTHNMSIKHDTRGDIRHRLQRCNGYAILLLIALFSTNNVSGFPTITSNLYYRYEVFKQDKIPFS